MTGLSNTFMDVASKNKKQAAPHELTEPFCPQTAPADQVSCQSGTAVEAQPNPPEDIAATGVALTNKNLAEHTRQQAGLWEDPEVAAELRRQQSEKLRAAARSFGVDLQEPLSRTVARRLDGMTPIERFFDDGHNH